MKRLRIVASFFAALLLTQHCLHADIAAAAQMAPDRMLFYTTTLIEAYLDPGVVKSRGTGFVVMERFAGSDKVALLLVTCAHVLHGMSGFTVNFNQADGTQPKLGEKVKIDVQISADTVFLDPDSDIDVAVIPITSQVEELKRKGTAPFFIPIEYRLAFSKNGSGLGAIQNIIFVGYPQGLIDSVNLIPLARRGISATPIDTNFMGKSVFLIDAAVFAGSSGSPVFVFDQGAYGQGGGLVLGTRLVFLGMISENYISTEKGEVKFVPSPSSQGPQYVTKQAINVGVVIKESVIFGTIEKLFHWRRLQSPERN